MVRACRDMSDVSIGRVFHAVAIRHGFESNPFVGASLVDMYAKCKKIKNAREVFDEMPSRGLVTWTVMIRAYTDSGDSLESLNLFDEMRNHGIVPEKFAVVGLISACAKLGASNKAKLVGDFIVKNGFLSRRDVILATAMIEMHSKCGSVDSARQVFESMGDKNVISWSAMIAAHGLHGQGREALELFETMVRERVSPNALTFVSLLHACSHSGLVEEGLEIFSSMAEKHGVRPELKHYTCAVDLLGRAGRLREAMDLIEKADERDQALWCAFLAAWKIHGRTHMDAVHVDQSSPKRPRTRFSRWACQTQPITSSSQTFTQNTRDGTTSPKSETSSRNPTARTRCRGSRGSRRARRSTALSPVIRRTLDPTPSMKGSTSLSDDSKGLTMFLTRASLLRTSRTRTSRKVWYVVIA